MISQGENLVGHAFFAFQIRALVKEVHVVDEDIDKKVDTLYRKRWLEDHPEYYEKYRESNKNRLIAQQRKWLKQNRQRRNRYMREYMRRYRKQKKA